MTLAAPANLLTIADLGTFAGLTGATVAVTNAASRLFGWSSAWVGFVVAFVLCEAMATIQPEPGAIKYLLALLNTCLVYASAGGTSAAGASLIGAAPLPAPGAAAPAFWRRWL